MWAVDHVLVCHFHLGKIIWFNFNGFWQPSQFRWSCSASLSHRPVQAIPRVSSSLSVKDNAGHPELLAYSSVPQTCLPPLLPSVLLCSARSRKLFSTEALTAEWSHPVAQSWNYAAPEQRGNLLRIWLHNQVGCRALPLSDAHPSRCFLTYPQFFM